MAGLLLLMFTGAAAEMATLGAVVPFLALLADPSMANKYPLLQKIFSSIGGAPDNMLLGAAILFGFIAVGAGIVRMLLMWASLRISYGLGADIGSEVYRSTLYQPYSWHVAHNSSEILAGIDKVNTVVHSIITPLLQGIVATAMSLGILVMLLLINPQTALIAGVGFSILYGVTTLLLRRHLVRNGKIISENTTHRIQALQEGLGGIRDVLLDGTQPIYHRRFTLYDYALRRGQATNNLIGASPRYIIESIGMVLIVALSYWLAGRQAGLTGAIPVLGALAIGAQKLLPQMQLVYQSFSAISGNLNQLNDVLELLQRSTSKDYSGDNSSKTNRSFQEPTDLKEPLIKLRNLSFRYRPDSPEVLRNITLDIHKGARVGFIGKTGSGKSTLIDLIMGLLEPNSGYIEIEGLHLNKKNIRGWQRRIAHVPQSIFLSDNSIAENIALGVPAEKIDFERVKAAANKAQLADFIETLPHKYNNPVGERGIRLSGGQRQRIGLARALYKQADVLVLDEATSALDDATEKTVMSAIECLGNELTVLMIAHRVSTLQNCDLIVELGHTRILRTGTYESLISAEPQNAHTQLLKNA